MINKIRENINNKEWIDNLFKLGFSGNEKINDDSLSEIISAETKNVDIFKDNFKRLLSNINNSEKRDLYNNTYRIANVIEEQILHPNLQIVNIMVNELEKFTELKELYLGIKSHYCLTEEYEDIKKSKLTLKDILYLDLILQQSRHSIMLEYNKNVLKELNLFIKENNFTDKIMNEFKQGNSRHVNYRDLYLERLTQILLIDNSDINKFFEKVIPELMKEIPILHENKNREQNDFLVGDENKIIKSVFKTIMENNLNPDFHFDMLLSELEKKNISQETFNTVIDFQKYLLKNAIKMEHPENNNIKKQRL